MNHSSKYDASLPAERLERYCPGGYHPIHLGDVLQDQYKILHKLGFGSEATVWLARDRKNKRNVSIKIIVASMSNLENRELVIMQTIQKIDASFHSGHQHIVGLLDSFFHNGPNGKHLCLVTELCGLPVSEVFEQFPERRIDGQLARRVSLQLLKATHFLHTIGIAHGDIHLGNVVFRFAESKIPSSRRFIKKLGKPRTGKVWRRDGAPLEKGLPQYLVEPVEYDIDGMFLSQVQLIDFGQSFFISEPPELIRTPICFRPPEVVFGHALTGAVDIWNLGCATYELVTSSTPFEAWMDDKQLILQFQVVSGGVPEKWIQEALKINGINYSAKGFQPLEQQLLEDYFVRYGRQTFDLDKEEILQLGRYLRKMLVVDPNQRTPLKDLFTETWVSEES